MPNRLASESSPSLLQHASNPVDWYPWGEAAFDRARQARLPNKKVQLPKAQKKGKCVEPDYPYRRVPEKY